MVHISRATMVGKQRLHPESHTQLLRNSYMTAFFLSPPKTFKLYVYTREAGRQLARTERSRVSWQAWKLSITQPGGPHRSDLAPGSHRKQRNVEISLCYFSKFFFSPRSPESPEMKGRLCTCSAHKQAVCQSESVIRGVFVKEIFRYLWVLRVSLLTSVYVYVCA